MSIADKLTQLTTIRGDIRSALTAKGVSASDHNFADFASDINGLISLYNFSMDGLTIKHGASSGKFPTSITLDGTVEVEYEYEVTERKNYGPHIFSGQYYFMPFIVNSSGSKLRTKISNTETNNDITPITGKIHIKSDFAHGKVICNNTEYSVTIPSSPSSDNINAVIGNYGGASGSDYSLVGIIYWLKVWKNGVLVADFVPAHNNMANTFGLFDKVTESYSEYTQQSYIEAYYEA